MRAYIARYAALLVLLSGLALAGCVPQATRELGGRPAQEPLDAVELIMQRYQPGPAPRVFQTTHVYDRNGALLATRWSEGRRTWVGLDRISRHLIDATIATEDATFYQNAGVDPARIAGAALQNAGEGQVVSGASTITMQLARMLFLAPDDRLQQSMDRKMQEAGLAQELTGLFSKDELLEMYLNLLNYGHLTYGPEAAAQVYFGKSAADLTWAEATLLAGIPQQPGRLDPLVNLAAARGRQRVVLDLLVRHGYLTREASDAIYAEELAFNPEPDAAQNLAPHFVAYVEDWLDSRLGNGATVRSGLAITTTLDLKMQTLAQDVVARKVKELQPRHDLTNGALVVLRPYTGEVLAMVGSADFTNAAISGQVNVARSMRQPGSSIKPVLYATAIEDNLISPATVLWDIPATFDIPGSKPYTPRNYDDRFHGPVTVRTALANSYNLPAVKLLKAVGIDRMLAGAEALGIRSLDRGRDYYGLALTLGGGEITLLELTTAYGVLASGGQAIEPVPVLQMGDILGRSVAPGGLVAWSGSAATAASAPLQAISPATAFLLTDILSDNAARTPMFGASSPLRLSKPAAAKTGTTDDWRDNWTLGYTRYLVAGAWAGNSDGHPMKNISGVAGAAPIWHDFMEGVLADPELLATIDAAPLADAAAWEFAPPEGVERRNDCPPGLQCRAGGEYFARTWLDAAGDAGPLADSVAKTPAAPIYAALPEGGRWTAYCRMEPAAIRTLLKLPGKLGLPGAAAAPEADKLTADERAEQLRVIGWSLRRPAVVDLGPCDRLPEMVPAALAMDPQEADELLQITIDLGAAMDVDVGPAPGEDAAPLQAVQAVAPGDHRYVLAGAVEHHSACPGNYIIGRVLNREGGPVAGVRIVLQDEWGNRAETVSKDGAADYGMYDFPIHNFANRYTLVVTDGAGVPISAPVVVEHLRENDAPCHTVNWIGG
ncbi:MAG: Penicillin-binding protein 2D [Chloroflexi bacterium ADurb.Bin325]|nr:MAG: Penicillin-binding protein 2D [Chloroflexi bacterium ADurb.Bin325]